METQVFQSEYKQTVALNQDFSWLERYALRRSHPRRMIMDIVAWMWATYFLWNHEWRSALAIIIVFGVLGVMAVRSVDVLKMSNTLLGKMALLHLHPMNVSLQVVGLAEVLYGVWWHSTEQSLVGLSVLFLGHIFGWSKVDGRLDTK